MEKSRQELRNTVRMQQEERKLHREAVRMKGLQNIKMSHKLIGGFVATSLAVGIVGGVGVYSMNAINENSKHLSDKTLTEIQALGGLRYTFTENKAYIHQLLDENNKSQMNDIINDIRETSKLTDEYIKQYESMRLTGEKKAVFEDFKKMITRLCSIQR